MKTAPVVAPLAQKYERSLQLGGVAQASPTRPCGRRLAKICGPVLLALLLPAANAEQMRKFGDHEAHYIVIPSLFLQADIANRHGLRRGKGLSIVNISVLDAAGKGTACRISGHARNLLEQLAALEFQEVREGDAVYYLAEVRHADQEVLRFNLNIQPTGAEAFELAFQQRLYAED